MLLGSDRSPNTSSNNSDFSFDRNIGIEMESDLPPPSCQLPLLSPSASIYANAGFPNTASASFPFLPPPGTNSFALDVGALGGDFNAGWSDFSSGLTPSPGPTPLPMPTSSAFEFNMEGIKTPSGYFQASAMAAMSKIGGGLHPFSTGNGVRSNGLYSAVFSDEGGSGGPGVENPARTLSADGSIFDSGLEIKGPSSRTSSSSGVSYGQKLYTGGLESDATSCLPSGAPSQVDGGNVMQQQQQYPRPGGEVPFDFAQRIISHPHTFFLNPTPSQHQGKQSSSPSVVVNRKHPRFPPGQQASPSISPTVLNNNYNSNQQQPISSTSFFSFNGGQPPDWSHYKIHQQQTQLASSSNIDGGDIGMQRIQSISGSSVGDSGVVRKRRRDSAWSYSDMEDNHSEHSHDHDSDVKPPKRTRRRSKGRISGSGGGRAPMVHSTEHMMDDNEIRDSVNDNADFGGVGGHGIEKNRMMWGMKTADYKVLDARERKRVRNRISARTFRARRKDHLKSLESILGDKDSIINALQNEYNDLKERLAKLEGQPYERRAGRR